MKAYFLATAGLGSTAETSSCGRAITCTLTTSPIGGRFDGGDIADDDGGHERVADLFHRTGQRDVGGFEHRIGAGDERRDTASFEET